MNAFQVVGLLLIIGGGLFFVIPALIGGAILSLFGLGFIGLLGLIPGIAIVLVGYYMYTKGAKWD